MVPGRNALECERGFQIAKEACAKLGMQISLKKSNYVSEFSGLKNDPSKTIMSLEGIESVQYLGSELEFDPQMCYHGQFSENAALKSERYFKSILSLSHASADPVLFLARLWEATAVPSILYSSESLLLRHKELARCESSQTALARYMLQIPELSSNVSAFLGAGLMPIWILYYRRVLNFRHRQL